MPRLSDHVLELILTLFVIPVGRSVWLWWTSHRRAATPAAKEAARQTAENTTISQLERANAALERANAEREQDLDAERRRRREGEQSHEADRRTWETERRVWETERRDLHGEIERLETVLRAIRSEYEARIAGLLDELAALKARHGIA